MSRITSIFAVMLSGSLTTGCITKGANPVDPYEPINRKIYNFNAAFDATMIKPPAKLYRAVLPAPVRAGINNVYDNVNNIPTVANDLLQAEWTKAIQDTWRFIINSTFGVAGILDVAKTFGLPPHSNDLGITFAKWGDKQSPYIMIPFLGPSTIRDGFGLMFNFALLTPYPYIQSDGWLYGILGLRYLDLRSQMLANEAIFNEAFDKYSFMRDAYLQHRNYLITGQSPSESLYVADDEIDDEDLLDTPAPSNNEPEYPLTTAKNHAANSTVPT